MAVAASIRRHWTNSMVFFVHLCLLEKQLNPKQGSDPMNHNVSTRHECSQDLLEVSPGYGVASSWWASLQMMQKHRPDFRGSKRTMHPADPSSAPSVLNAGLLRAQGGAKVSVNSYWSLKFCRLSGDRFLSRRHRRLYRHGGRPLHRGSGNVAHSGWVGGRGLLSSDPGPPWSPGQTLFLSILMRTIGKKNTVLLGLGFQLLQLVWYSFGSEPWSVRPPSASLPVCPPRPAPGAHFLL